MGRVIPFKQSQTKKLFPTDGNLALKPEVFVTGDENTIRGIKRNRWYDPELGIFISRDPVQGNPRDPQTYNPYQYALNNPIRYRDPLGLWAYDHTNGIATSDDPEDRLEYIAMEAFDDATRWREVWENGDGWLHSQDGTINDPGDIEIGDVFKIPGGSYDIHALQRLFPAKLSNFSDDQIAIIATALYAYKKIGWIQEYNALNMKIKIGDVYVKGIANIGGAGQVEYWEPSKIILDIAFTNRAVGTPHGASLLGGVLGHEYTHTVQLTTGYFTQWRYRLGSFTTWQDKICETEAYANEAKIKAGITNYLTKRGISTDIHMSDFYKSREWYQAYRAWLGIVN